MDRGASADSKGVGSCRGPWRYAVLGPVVRRAPGCQFVPRSQLTACETRTRALSEQTQAQLAEIANLKAHNHRVEDRLIKAEEELALLEEQAGLEHKRVTNYESERNRLNEQLDGLGGRLGRPACRRRIAGCANCASAIRP